MKKNLLRIVLVFIFNAVLSLGVFADDRDVALEKIIVISSRMAQHDYKVAGNVTVIDQEDIEASQAQNIPEILNEALAVHVVDNSTVKTAVLDIRGFGDTAARNVLVLVNDRILNTVDISGPDLLQIPISSVDRIEIIRGAGSVLYGDRAVGGVVNIITKKGKGPLSGRLGAYTGSYDRRGMDLEVSGSKKKLSYFFYSRYDDNHGYRQNSNVLSKDFNTRLGYEFSPKISMDVDYSYHQDDYGLPGALSGANLSALGPRASTNLNDFANSKDNNLKFGFNVTPWPEDLYLGDLVFDGYLRDRDVFDSFSGFDTSRTIKTVGLTTKYIFDHTIFNKEFHFVTGIDYYDTQNDIIGSGSNTDDLTISKADIGLFNLTEYEVFDHLYLNGGARYYKADYAFSQRNGVSVDERQRPDVFVYLGGLKVEYAKGSNVHMNIQRTFRFLATDEWYSSFSGTLDTSLNQQKGIQYEVGVKHNFNDTVAVTITPYLMDITNEIFFDPTTFANSNYDKTRRYGVELGQETDILKFFDLKFLHKLKLTTNYTWQRPLFKGGTSDGKNIPLVPKQQLNGGISSHFLKDYHLSLMGHYVGAQFAINDQSNLNPKVEPYFIVDTKVAYQKPNYEIYAGMDNIFNQQYSSTVVKSAFSSAESFYPAPGRNFNVGMNIKF